MKCLLCFTMTTKMRLHYCLPTQVNIRSPFHDGNRVFILPICFAGAGYIQVKARLGMKKVRKWEWAPFTNPARADSAVFHHWRRTTDESKEYPFAKFNKQLNIPTYTANEYNAHLKSNQVKWSKAQTDHLFDLAIRFDLRFVIMADRWDRANYGTKTVEDLKERYYEVLTMLNKVCVCLCS